tara:strand:+ start:11329 stop:11517 length:189 start_codon:yes stop_codon:yes gene_type:complete
MIRSLSSEADEIIGNRRNIMNVTENICIILLMSHSKYDSKSYLLNRWLGNSEKIFINTKYYS